MIRQIFRNVLAINKEANTSFGSSRKFMIRFAAECCFVLRTLISFSFSEKSATSAPDMVKTRNNNTARRIISIVIPCVSAARKIKDKLLNKRSLIE